MNNSTGIRKSSVILNAMSHFQLCKEIDDAGNTGLHYAAFFGMEKILPYPETYTIKNKHGEVALDLYRKYKTENAAKDLFQRADDGDVTVLQDPNVAKFFYDGETPLHRAAIKNIPGVLQHPDVSKAKDWTGITPLHKLAFKEHDDPNIQGITDHPDFGVVTDVLGFTPKDLYECDMHFTPTLSK